MVPSRSPRCQRVAGSGHPPEADRDPAWVGRFAEIEITEIKTLNLVYGELLNLEPDVA